MWWALCFWEHWMTQGCVHLAKVSRAGSLGEGGGCDGRWSVTATSPLWASCHPPHPHYCQRHQVSFSCVQGIGARELFALPQVLGQACLFPFLMGSCSASQGTAFLRCSQTHPVWWIKLWLTHRRSSLWTKSALVLVFILVWNLTSLELLWSCSSIIESGIRHQSPLYSPDWGELSYQCEHLNVNEAEEMEFCSQRLLSIEFMNKRWSPACVKPRYQGGVRPVT